MKKPMFEQVVWVVCWPKGTTDEWKQEKRPPKDYMPIDAETNLEFQYYIKIEKRTILDGLLAVFGEYEEAAAWRKAADFGSFVICKAKVAILCEGKSK